MGSTAAMSGPPGIDHLHAEVRLFFVTGAHKSGTSWVELMLQGHPEVSCVGEAWFIGFTVSSETWIDRGSFDKWMSIPTVRLRWMKDLDPDRVRQDVQRMMIETVMRQRWEPGIRAIGDKTPFFYLRDVELLHAMFPETVLISVVRDGRDVAVSHQFQMLRNSQWRFFDDKEQGKKSRRYHIEGEGDPEPLFTERTLRGYGENWRICSEGSRRASELFGDRFIEYRYDELKHDPTVIRSALESIGVDASENSISRCVASGDFKKWSKRKPGQSAPGEFFRKGISGDWVSYFTERDKEIYKDEAGQALIDEGYADDLNW